MFVEINSRRIPLEVGHLYLLGKRLNALPNDNDKQFIQLEDKDDVDQKHCIIEVGRHHSEDVFIFDLFSSQGTLLNNQPLKSLNKMRLKNGDVVKTGTQEIKFFKEQQEEVSHDSSGFLDVNRNTSDIVNSSHESTPRHNQGLKNNFLIPVIPVRSSVTPNTSGFIAETEVNNTRNSLNASSSSNNRRSESFTIPETQYCQPRTSINSSDLSIAESITDTKANNIKFNFGNLDDDDDICIPETQEPVQITNSQKPRIIEDEKNPQHEKVIENKTVELEAEDSTKDIEGSQFRICTQEYNDGFGEELNTLHSQIIPLITHKVVVLNASSQLNDSSKCQSQCERRNKHDDKEQSSLSIKVSAPKGDQGTTSLRADCTTPDIFDLNNMEQSKGEANEENKTKVQDSPEEDEYDLLPTQFFSLQTSKQCERIMPNDIDKPCVEKENEEIITLSDKENRCPKTLEPITDLPPTQLFVTNETKSTSPSTSSRSNFSSAIKTSTFTAPTAVPRCSTAENKKKSNLLPNLDPDDEDDLLTQAFLLPSTSNAVNSTNNNVAAKCFNSTLLDENKALDKSPANYFDEMEKTPLKQTTTFLSVPNAFQVPDKESFAVKKTSSAISATSDSDLDLLMCTPQLIKEHIKVNVKDDLRKNILAAKNKNLFGNDTDEEDSDDDSTDLVKLINVPKDFKDFDKLLPHLKSVKKQPAKESEQKKAAREAQKKYKFNIFFGKEQEEAQQSSTSKSAKFDRDERHMARDRERELAERKGKMKSDERKHNKKKNNVKDDDPHKQERQATPNHKTSLTVVTDKSVGTEQEETKKENSKVSSGENSKEKSVGPHTENPKKVKERTRGAKKSIEKDKPISTKEKKDQKKSLSETKSDHIENQKPTRRITRSKSIYEDNTASTSKEALNKTKTKEAHQSKIYAEDDLDSVSTQPFVPITRRLNSKNSEDNTATSIKSTNNASRNETSSTENTSINDSIKKTALNERKRKTEPPPAIAERKRLRSTHSQDSSNPTHSSSDFCISMTMVDPELFQEFVKKSNGVWHVAKDPAESKILVMDKAFRTFKFLLAMARGIPIVTSEYLKKVNELQSIRRVRVTDYLFSDAEFEKKHKFTLVKSLKMAKRQKIFKDYEFLLTPNIQPNPSEIKAIIEAAGGLVYNKYPPEPKEGQQLYLVSSVEDKKEWHKYRRLNKNITIISTEAIMSSVMRQTTKRMSSYTFA